MKRVLLAALLATAGPAWAQMAWAQAPDIQVDQPWARATPGGGKSGVVYLTLIDHGGPDTLTGISTPAAGMAMLHESFDDNGMARMRMLDGLKLDPRAPVALRPGGMHVMLTDLVQPLRVGATFPLTLTFAKASPVTVTVRVLKIGSPGPASDMPGMKGMAQ